MIEVLRTKMKGMEHYDYMSRVEKIKLLGEGVKFSDSYSCGYWKDWDHFWREKDNESSSIEEHHESQ